MLNRAAYFATLIAGAGLTAALIMGASDPVAAEPQAVAMVEQGTVLEHAPSGWNLQYEGDAAKLTYGIANSDQIQLMLTCAVGSRTVEVFGPASPDAERVRLMSATGATEVAVSPEPDPMSGAASMKTELPSEAAALQGFRQNGRLTVTVDEGRDVPMHAVRAETPQVQAFFDHCERRSI